MGGLLSMRTSITTITVLFTGGLAILWVYADGDTVIWWNPVTFILWSICLVWLVAMLYYRRQRVNIRILTQGLQQQSGEEFSLTLTGYIDTRHPDGLANLKLWLIPNMGIEPTRITGIPPSVDTKPQRFRADYLIQHSFAKQAMQEQQTDGVNMAYVLSANMGDADWLIPGDVINVGFVKNMGGSTMKTEATGKEARRKRKAEKRKEGPGINSSQFHRLLDKTVQPIKKSDSEKA